MLWLYGCLYTSESDVYILQIQTYKDGSRAEKVKYYLNFNYEVVFNSCDPQLGIILIIGCWNMSVSNCYVCSVGENRSLFFRKPR